MEDGLDELPLRKKLPRLKEEALEKTFQAEKVSSASRDSQGQYAATMAGESRSCLGQKQWTGHPAHMRKVKHNQDRIYLVEMPRKA